jgi:hypothetical protein
MIDFLRTRRCRLPLAVLLLLVTQLAFAGQSCRAVMFDMGGANEAAAMQHAAPASDLSLASDAQPCCGGDPPPPSICLVAVDAVTATALVASGEAPLPVLAPPAYGAAARDVFAWSRAAPAHPTASARPSLPAYIVYRRFLS